jgi:hypothetical protein
LFLLLIENLFSTSINFKAHAIVPKKAFKETLKQKHRRLAVLIHTTKGLTVKHSIDIHQTGCIEKEYLFPQKIP